MRGAVPERQEANLDPSLQAPIALLAAIAWLIVPFGPLAYAVGARGARLLAASATCSLAYIGIMGIVSGLVPLPLRPWSSGLVALAPLAAGVVLLVRRRSRAAARPPARVAEYLGVAVAAVVVGVVALRGIGDWTHISQTYDAVFHLNAAAYIAQTGEASSFRLYSISIDGGGVQFYPAVWHSLVALVAETSGASIPVATNAAWLAVAGVVWPAAIAGLTRRIAGSGSALLGATAAIVSALFTAFPYLLLDWGTLYPMGLAYAILPVGVDIALVLVPALFAPGPGSAARWLRAHALALVAAAVWLTAAALSHPRSLFSLMLVVGPLLLASLGAWAVRDRGDRRHVVRVRRVLGAIATTCVVVAGAGAWYVFRTYDLAARPISDHLNGGPATAHQGLLVSLLQPLELAPVASPTETPLPPQWVLAALTLLGLVLLARRRSTRWIVAAYVLVVLLYALAAGSNSDLAKLATGLWYKDKYRLASLLPLVAVPATVVALHWLLVRARAVLRARGAVLALAGAATVASVLAAVLVGSPLRSMSAAISDVFRLGVHKDGALVDRDEYALLAELPRLVPHGAVVAGNPWNGSTLSWALGSRQSLFPHLTGVWSPPQLVIASRLDQALADPSVCRAAAQLHVEYVVDDPELLWGGAPEAQLYSGISRAASTPGVLTPLARRGHTTLFELTACRG